ncbi:FadR family transcriptional regulator [Bacillaceae bacterium Marseille-Q3522]|nr:FadR family transcriptional regulator [Bacillaceae bacterium Marseille-Q3522]
MESPSTFSKIYIEIVKQLRILIEKEGLKPGDKLPSERELAVRFQVGRSSVREAFRALELLGLIETKRGGGTFLRDFHGNQLVQLLSTYILRDEQAKYTVTETKHFIELNCLSLIIQKKQTDELTSLKNFVEQEKFTDDEFFLRVVTLADNYLFCKMWVILKDYYNSLAFHIRKPNKEEYQRLLTSVLLKDEEAVKNHYWQLRNISGH